MISSAIRRNLRSISSSSSRSSSILSRLPASVQISAAVLDALHSNSPIVALESTIITHGLPSNDDPTNPTNLKCALQLEQTVRDNGATPATIALIDGKVHIGLHQEQLIRLANSPNQSQTNSIKTGERDVANVLAMGKGTIGGTTVSATLFLAHMAGISFFGTGGLGGCHRGSELSMDISADLPALARHPVSVFCSGAKSILDIPRTLEYLETSGVPVSTFSKSGQFPAFYTADSGCKVSIVSSINEAARVISEQRRLYQAFSNEHSTSFSPGHVFGVPIPSQFEKQGLEIQKAVEKAVLESQENGMDRKGKEVTPWLLKRVKELTGSTSLESNVALVVNNTKVASQVAVEVEKLRKEFEGESARKSFRGVDLEKDVKSELSSNQDMILVFGLAAIDLTSQFRIDPSSSSFKQATTYPGKVRVSLGGVGRNVAEASNRLLSSLTSNAPITQLVAPIGERELDPFSKLLVDGLKGLGMRVDGLFNAQDQRRTSSSKEDHTTPVCSLLLDSDGDLINGVADMEAADTLNPERISETFQRLQSRIASGEKLTIAMDGNLSVESMVRVLEEVSSLRNAGMSPTLLFEPTSISKSTRLLHAFSNLSSTASSTSNLITISTPNEIELNRLFEEATQLGLLPESISDISATRDKELSNLSEETGISHSTLKAAEILSNSGFLGELILVKLGSRGALSVQRSKSQEIQMKLHPIPKALPPGAKLNTTGAGDTTGGVILASSHVLDVEPGSWNEKLLEGVVRLGQKASAMTLLSDEAVSSEVNSLGSELLKLCRQTNRSS